MAGTTMGPVTGAARVRPATAADLPEIAAIFGHYARHTLVTFEEAPRPLAAWAALHGRLAGVGLPFLVAQAGDAVIGYAYASPWRDKPGYRHTAEDSVFVAPGQTGHGTGRRLLADLLAACDAGGIRQVVAVIADPAGGGPQGADAGPAASLALHVGAGFTLGGRLAAVGRKHGRWIDTVLLQRAAGGRAPAGPAPG